MTWQEKIAYHNRRANEIGDKIISQIETGVHNWEMPWHKGLPQAFNRVTGKYYGGNNLLILWDECITKGYSQNVWATMRQWNRINSGVKKGSKGTLIKFVVPQNEIENYDQLELELADDESDDVDGYKIFFHYVFNVDQVTNYDQSQIGLFDSPLSKFEKIDDFIKKTEAKIEHKGNRAFYNFKNDLITIPHKASFKKVDEVSAIENYYATLLHEIIHWTGHSSRCDRSLINEFGTSRYAFEELIAELGTAILTSHFQNRNVPRITHAKYVNSWLSILKNDFKFFIQALELSRTAIYWLYQKTQILPFDLTFHYTRSIDEKLTDGLDEHLTDVKSDSLLRQVYEHWDSIDIITQEKIVALIKDDINQN